MLNLLKERKLIINISNMAAKVVITETGKFVWLVINNNQAKAIWRSDQFTMYILYGDDGESMVESEEDLMEAVMEDREIGIEVGYID